MSEDMVFTPAVFRLCTSKLYRCCGEGPLICDKPYGHRGPHEDEGVCWG